MASEFIHRFEPGTGAAPPLLALHGTGGDEHDLVPLARMISPASPVLSPRGKVLENGMPRFFRRLAEGVFDLDDLRLRTEELGEFIVEAARRYHFDEKALVAVGYSNGANIAASLLLSRGDLLAGAVLLRAMVPFEPASVPALAGKRILINASRQDQMIPAASTERLAELLTTAGADVTTRWYPTGHALSQHELQDATEWFGNPSKE